MACPLEGGEDNAMDSMICSEISPGKSRAKQGRPLGGSTSTPKKQKVAVNNSINISPGPVTRRQLAQSMAAGEGSSQPRATSRATPPPSKKPAKKLTPRKGKK